MDRVNTGIQGLDKLVGGGIPAGSSVLIAGSCGTGKTILSLQFLYKGALENEPGVYVTFEESEEKILRQGMAFGWDLKALMDKGLLDIYVVETDDMDDILSEVGRRVDGIKAKRLVLDSLTTMMEHGVVYRSKISRDVGKREKEKKMSRFPVKGFDVTRKDIYFVIGEINRLGATSLLISEAGEGGEYISRDTISEFACDGVIQLRINEVGGEIERLLSVRKLRGTGIAITLSLMKFTDSGIVIEE
jgi:circadian clock protein KaiC